MKIFLLGIIPFFLLSILSAYIQTGEYSGQVTIDTGNLNVIIKNCTEDWSCSFNSCNSGTSTFECKDCNNCGTSEFKPTNCGTTSSCSLGERSSEQSNVKNICLESWNCTSWSSCKNDTQSRTCQDKNKCGTIFLRPKLNQTCYSNQNITESEENSNFKQDSITGALIGENFQKSWAIVLAFIIIVVGVSIFIRFR